MLQDTQHERKSINDFKIVSVCPEPSRRTPSRVTAMTPLRFLKTLLVSLGTVNQKVLPFRFAFHANVAAMPAHNLPGDIQTQTGTFGPLSGTWKNFSKIRSWYSFGIPLPVSFTVKRTAPLVTLAPGSPSLRVGCGVTRY